ncbi:MAG: T9SS type A sorting domain-containing protein [Flavobacteriales bacterium]
MICTVKNFTNKAAKAALVFSFVLSTQVVALGQTFTGKSAHLGEWTHFPGIVHKPTNSIYLPGGYSFGDIKQVLRYDVVNDSWTAIASPAGMQSQLGYSFTINNRMFFGGGADLGFVFGNQLWELSPPSTFTAQDNIPVPDGLCASFSFSLGNFGFVGEGYGWNGAEVNSNALWRFNPIAAPGSQWTAMTPYPGQGQINSGCVTLNGAAYVACGRSSPGVTEYNDFWRYTPGGGGGTWTALPAFPGPGRENAILMRSCNDKIVLMGGFNAGTGVYYDDVWVYDPAMSMWTFIANDPAVTGPMGGRYGPGYCAYGDSLFFGMGFGNLGPNDDWNLFTYCPISVLPVELTSFQAVKNMNNQVDVTWQTAAEINNDYFEIYRSTNATDWEKIGTVDGAGNSSSLLNYRLLDPSPYIGLNYYRLKQVDFNGSETLSGIVSVTITHYSNAGLTVFPNPVEGYFQVSETITGPSVSYAVYDGSGQLVLSGALSEEKNTVRTESLSQGIYFVFLGDKSASPIKIVKL